MGLYALGPGAAFSLSLFALRAFRGSRRSSGKGSRHGVLSRRPRSHGEADHEKAAALREGIEVIAMRVAELIGLRRFRLAETGEPEPGPGEVQVRIQAVGVCGSDMHSYAEGGIGRSRCIYPMVLGHEPAGVVVKTGAGVSGWRAGDAAACEPALYCYHCETCTAGRHNVCANLEFSSSPGHPGFFREYVNLPARNLLALPSHIGAKEGTLIEPLAVALHSMKFAALKPGGTAAVLGAGPIGLLTVAVLKLSGASRVWAIDPLPARREPARAQGTGRVMDPSAVEGQHLHGLGVRRPAD